MPNAKQRRTLRRALDRCVSVLTGVADGPARLARRFRSSRSFWRLVERREQGEMWGEREEVNDAR